MPTHHQLVQRIVRTNPIMRRLLAGLLLSALGLLVPTASAQGTAFTYNGSLTANGGPANGDFDLAFSLFTSPTNEVATAGPITNSATIITNGLFMVTLDFGAGIFTGTNYWLDISVRPSGSNTFTELTPRQPITPSPYTVYSENAGMASIATLADIADIANQVAATNIVGTLEAQQLPAGLVVNNQNGVNLSGNFTGDGTELTNVPAVTWSQDLSTNLVLTFNGQIQTFTCPATNVIGFVSFSGTSGSISLLLSNTPVVFSPSGILWLTAQPTTVTNGIISLSAFGPTVVGAYAESK